MNIVVLAGGISPERDVSLTSGSLIANALIRNGHAVALVDVYIGIDENQDPGGLFVRHEIPKYKVSEEIPDLDGLKKKYGREALIGPGVLEICQMADAVFVALHGAMGENGQLQATFDNFKIKYTGSGYIGSLLAMDKDLSKQLFSRDGIKTPEWVYFDIEKDGISEITQKIGIPCVVKPCSCGSSVGVTIVDDEKQLKTALELAGKYEKKVLVEKKITGRELTVAILDGRVLPSVEIIPLTGFYDYKNKYQEGCTKDVCPAEITPEQQKRLEDAAIHAFEVLRLDGYARFDFIMDTDGECWLLEANNLPGMTPTSLVPQMARAAGIDYDTLCEMIINLALNKKE